MYLERTSTYSVASTRAPNMLPPRSPAKQAHHHLAPPPSTFGTKALYTIGTLACLLLFISTFHERRNSMKHVDESGRWNGQRVQDRQLTMQLDKNDLEIVSLKAQLSSMSSGSKLVDTSMQDQEETVRKLQKRFDNEKAARAKAQYALQERSDAFERCQEVHNTLKTEAEECHRDLKLMKGS